MPSEIYTIEVFRPESISVHKMRQHIKEAVASWGGGYKPDHPLYYSSFRNNVHTVHRAEADIKFRGRAYYLYNFPKKD